MLKLVPGNDPILKQKMPAFDFSMKEGIDTSYGKMTAVVLFEQLRDMMCRSNGVGLSANQVGINVRVFVIGDPGNVSSVIPVFNPQIVNYSDEKVDYSEGCLSFPGLFIDIKRPRTIRARYANQYGDVETSNFEGFTSRVFQHEYDHLEGIVYKEKVSRLKLDTFLRAKKKLDLIRTRRPV
jgi:peptide deformylase